MEAQYLRYKSRGITVSFCTQMRRKLVTRKSFNMGTGVSVEVGQDWVTEPCNAPMFTDVETQRGTCRSCANGWTHEHNFPVAATEVAVAT